MSQSTKNTAIQSVVDYAEHCVEHLADDEIIITSTEIQRQISLAIKKWQMPRLEPVKEANLGVEVNFMEELKQLCKTRSKVTELTTVYSTDFKSAEVNKMSEFLVTAKLSNGKPTRRSQTMECQLKRLTCGSLTSAVLRTSGVTNIVSSVHLLCEAVMN